MINAAIVGLGRWGRRLVAAVQAKSGKIRFVSCVVRRPEAACEFASEHGLPIETDLTEVLASQRVQAVVLATPHSLHVEQIAAAAGAGKAVFCEKPLALTRADAERAVDACRRAGVALGLGHDKRFWGSMRALRELTAGNTLGQLLHLEGHFSNESTGRYYEGWRASAEDAPAGGLTAMGIHLIDAFVSLAGPVRHVQAHVVSHPSSRAPVDTLTLYLEFASRVSGVLCGVRTSPQYWRVHAFGNEGSAEAIGATDLTLRTTDAEPQHLELEPVDSLRLELEAFADAVAGAAPYPITLQQMIDGIAVLEASIRSFSSGERVQVES